jgi:putative sulfotransferase
MAIDQVRILAEVSELLRAVSKDPQAAKEITGQTMLIGGLQLRKTDIAELNGRVHSRYGAGVSLAPFFARIKASPPRDARVDALAGYLAAVLAAAAQKTKTAPPAKAAPHGKAAPRATAPATNDGTQVTAPPGGSAVIISSGRCGSTLLSRLIAREPQTLSVSESLGHVRNHLLFGAGHAFTGAQYWELLSEPGVAGELMAKLHFTNDEFRYPDSGRYAADRTTLPRILRVTLPALTADPDDLFDQLTERVPRFPDQPVAQHHKMLLDLLTHMMGRRRWVERSGGSSLVAKPVLTAFPEARIVYLTRNIADTARSMSQHPYFQASAAMYKLRMRSATSGPQRPGGSGQAPGRGGQAPSVDELPKEARLQAGQLSAEALQEASRDIDYFEATCAHMHGAAEQALADLRPQHVHQLRYEDLLADPRHELTRLGEFLGFADPGGWAGDVAAVVAARRRVAS